MTTIQETDLSLQNLQRRVGEWADYNFGANRKSLAYRSLFGIIEEFGELVHSQLKMEQGIRGTIEEHMAKIRDAVGDLVFYMMDYLHMMNEAVDFDWPKYDPFESWGFGTMKLEIIVFRILVRIADVAVEHEHYSGSHARSKCQLLLTWLNSYCIRSSINMQQAVWETAEQVFERDWIKFPKDGRTE